jgi:UDP-N-acetylmuramate--alanine ligase
VRVAGQVEPVFVEEVGDLPNAIRKIARDGDVVVTMGAGSIGSVPAAVSETKPVKH